MALNNPTATDRTQIGLACRCLAMLVLGAAVSGCISTAGRGVAAGPLVQSGTDMHGNRTIQALGPVLERQVSEHDMTFTAVRPFWSRVTDQQNDRAVSDFLWPLGMDKVKDGERDWRLFPAFGHDFDVTQSPSRHRWAVFPLLFGGRSLQNVPYFACFPFGGTLREFLGRDRIVFVLFPLYAYSEMNTMRTHSIFWPIYSRSLGDGVDRLRVWPFYGVSRNQDRWTKRFIMWPFWTSVRYEYPDQKGKGFVLWPLYGQVDVGARHSRMLFPPLFKLEWAGDGHRAYNAPWPFLQYSRGRLDKFYLWPLYGRKRMENEKQWFALWPLVSSRQTQRPKTIRHHFRALPLIYYESTHRRQADKGETPADDRALSRYFKLWPLVSFRREGNRSCWRTLALWPLKRTPGVERNWAPLWSLFTRERVGDTIDAELLWGLYRHRYSPDQRHLSIFPFLQTQRDETEASRAWSILYGLLGMQKTGSNRRWTLLYFFNFGGADAVD